MRGCCLCLLTTERRTPVNLRRVCARIVLLLVVLASCAESGSIAWAGPLALGPAADFNVFVFGNNTQSNSDTEGRVAVGGDANFTLNGSGWTVGTQSPGNSYNLIVGGNLTNQYNTLHGGLLVGGNVNWNTPSITGNVAVNGNASFGNSGGTIGGTVDVVGTYSRPGYYPPNHVPPTVTPLPFDFAAVKSQLQSQSTYLAGLVPNGSTTISFSQVLLNAAGPQNGFYTFNVTGAQLAAASGHGLSITAPSGSTVVVNINGTADSFQSMGITLNGVDNQHVLYNFNQATSLTLNAIGIEGTILAPWANVNFINGQINGSLIAQSLTGSGESHLHLFQGSLPIDPVPEPSTMALAAIGAAALVFAARRRS